MNYQDTSSLTGTDARSDADVIPAGSNAPAVGNTITGAGTVSGAAGADIVGQAPGHIVAVQGAGGGDTSSSGEAMQVSGRYGVLNMEADGGYRYTRNGDTPDGVRDVFTYTLADAGNARDVATLTIDIGRNPVVVQANAQQVVPGPDGVVTLPAGVTMADVHVVGRNLVIDMPDGTQMVIIDGAVFVPQLVLGGVEIPATTIANLLVDSEPPAPTAGPAQSSGGNFGLPPAPLDPGVPLGDLIPPVEQDYTPPIFEDVGQFIDDEPEIFIQPDGQPASVAAVDSVDERGLPSPRLNGASEPPGSLEGADGNGANNSNTSEATSGVIIIDARDTPTSITITVNGTTTAITGTVPQVIQGQYGTLTITSVSDTQIGYSYVLRDNTSGDATHDDFVVTLTDNDGDQASATLRIDIIDDVPTANADVDSVSEDGTLVATGNIILGGTDAGDANTTDGVADVRGADNGVLTSFNGAGGNGTFGVALAGQYGSIILNANGSYTYTLNNQLAAVQALDSGESLVETYNYTITDSDGDTSTTTLRITINGTNDAPIAVPDTNWAQEDVANASGNVLQTLAHPGDPSPSLSFSDQADTDVDVEALTVTTTGNRGGTYGVLTLNADGSYSYILNNANASVQGLDSGETLTETYNYTVTDGTATATATLTITIFGSNDAPVAVPDTNWAQEDVANASGNVLQTLAHPGDPSAVLSFSDQADTDIDVENLTVTTTGNRGGTYGVLTLNADGSYSYILNNGNASVQGLDSGETLTETYNYTVTDGDATASATLTITIFGSNDAPVAVPDTNWAQEDGADASGNVLQTLAHPGDPSAVLSFSDQADTDIDVENLTVTTTGNRGGTYGVLTLNADGSYSYILNDANASVQALDDLETLTETYNYTVTDGDATATATLTITIFGSNDAPVAVPDTNWAQEDGADAAGNVLQTLAHPGDPSAVLSFSDQADTDIDVENLTVTTTGNRGGTYGVLTLNADGSYSYILNDGNASVQALDDLETLTETYNYTVTDGTATATATLTITIFGSNDAPVAVPDTNWAQEDVADASGNVLQTLAHPGDPSAVLSFSDQADTDIDVENLTVTTTGNRGGTYGVLTLNADGSYSYILNDANASVQALDDLETLTETYNYTVTDGTATATATLTITIFGSNDAPVAVPDTNWTEEGAGPIGGNVLQTIAHPGDPSPVLSFSDQADTDVDVETLTVTTTGNRGGTYGTLTLNADGSYSYQVNNANPAVSGLVDGATLLETYNYTVTDGTATATATLTITIFGTNDGPSAVPDTNWAQEDVADASGNVLLTLAHPGDPSVPLSFSDQADTDPDADPLTVTTTGNRGGTYGTLTLNANGTYSYILNDAHASVQALDDLETLTETYNYTVTDGTATATATLTITIFGSNDAPVAVPDTNWAQEDVADASGNVLQTLAHPGDPSAVLSFSDQADTDIDVENLTVTTTGNRGGTYGVLTLNADGSYSYILNDGNASVQALDDLETLTETYNYTVTDGTATATATLTITIFGSNDAPVAVPDTNWAQEDGADAAGNVLQTLAHAGDPSPVLSFSDQADTDVDVEALTVTTTGNRGGTYGTLTLNANGSYSYILNDGNASVQALDDLETLTETYNYTVTDGTATATATLTITIFGSNDAPVAVPDTNWAQEDVADASGNVLLTQAHPGDPSVPLSFSDQADTDVDVEALTVTTTGNRGGTYGTLTLNADGSYNYILNDAHASVQALDDGETLTESYNYTITDGTATASSTLTITIFGSNDAPVAVPDTNWAQEDVADASGNVLLTQAHPGDPSVPLSFSDQADTDVDVEPLTVTTTGNRGGTYGTLTLNADGSYNYILNDADGSVQALDDGETLTETYNYTVTDGTATASSTLTITIFGSNDAPTIQPSSVTISDEGIAGIGNPDSVGNPTDTTNSASGGGTMVVADVDIESLTVVFTSTPAGLTVDGVPLVWSGVGTNTITGTASGGTLTLTIDNSGNYLVTLSGEGIDQLTANAENLLTFNVNVRVSDGSATNTAQLTVTIEDDSPEPFTPDPVASLTGAQPAITLIPLNLDMGADGLRTTNSLVFDIANNGMIAKDSAGNTLTVGGQTLYLHGDGTANLYATTTLDGTGAHAFDVILDPATGTYSFDVNAVISNGTQTSFTNLTGAAAGNVAFRGVGTDVANNNAGNIDILLSGQNNSEAQITVNTSSTSIGSGNQSIGAGETIRIDLVNNLSTSNPNSTGFSYNTYAGTTSFTQTVPQINGQPGLVTINVAAVIDPTADASFGYYFNDTPLQDDEAIRAITSVKIFDNVKVGNGASPVGETITVLDPGNDTPIVVQASNGGATYTVTFNDDGTVTIEGMGATDQYQINTAQNFNAILVNSDASNGSTFDLGIFTIGTFNAGIPIDQDFTVVATDGDGDSVTGVIQTTIVADVAGNQVGTTGADNIVGGAGDNALAGNAGNDTIAGNGGNDYVYGGGGNDILNGGDGNDVLEGGTGADNLTGGTGNDVFVLSTAAITAGQVDTIVDYGAGDVVDIREILNVAGSVDPIADGYLRVTTSGLVQVDLTGGGNSWQTLANINTGVSPVSVRYIDGGVVTTIPVTTTVAAMEAPSSKSLASVINEQQAANSNSVLLGAIAGAGLMSASAAAAAPSFDVASLHNDIGFSQSSLLSSTSLRSIEPMGLVASPDGPMLDRDGGLGNASHGGFQQQSASSEGIAGHAAAEAPAVSALSQGNDLPVAAQAADTASFAAGDVAMPSLEALAASVAQQGDSAQAQGNVAQVLADALAGGGGADIDSLLASLPGGGGDAADALASHDMAAVSAWDMGAIGGFTGFHQAFTMETLVLHQDVVVQQA